MTELPAATLRLFPHHQAADLAFPEAVPFVVGRLLEDGDRADLRWLFGALPEAAVAAWLASRGGRGLSRRSCAFWELAVGLAAAPDPAAAELWPL